MTSQATPCHHSGSSQPMTVPRWGGGWVRLAPLPAEGGQCEILHRCSSYGGVTIDTQKVTRWCMVDIASVAGPTGDDQDWTVGDHGAGALPPRSERRRHSHLGDLAARRGSYVGFQGWSMHRLRTAGRPSSSLAQTVGVHFPIIHRVPSILP